MDAMIRTENLRRIYNPGPDKVVALANVNLTVPKGEILCILGTSGSGKSTLLNMLAGLEKPSHGLIYINNEEITRMSERKLTKFRQKNIGFVFQSYNLMNDITALENVAMPLEFRGVPPKIRNAAAEQMLIEVGLGDRIKHKPREMSGGQQQRVGIARAFVAKPTIVFADEPTGNLDSKTTDTVMRLMVRMAKSIGQTFVIVTHDPETSVYCDRVITLVDGEIISDVYNEQIEGA